MSVFFKKRISKKQKKQAEKLFLDFLEGRITTKYFWEEYKNNYFYQNVLICDKKRWKKTYMLGKIKMKHFGKGPFDKIFEYNPDTLLNICDINKMHDIYCLYVVISRYFLKRKIDFVCGNKEANQYLFLQKFVPSYIEINDGEYLQEIFNSTEQELSQKERINQAKEKIKEIYSYNMWPPKWVQSPEWPIDEDGPLIFSHQKREIGKCLYYFYNKKQPSKQIIVEQFE